MQGRNKALVTFAGQPLLAHVLAALRPQVDDIILNANRDQEALSGFGLPVVADRNDEQAGPLAGIAACLPHCRHERVLVTPCDTPFLPDYLLQRLNNALDDDHDIAVAHDGQRLQPLCMLLRRSCLAAINASLEKGHYKVESWCREQRMALAHFESPRIFTNLNTLEEVLAEEKKRGD